MDLPFYRCDDGATAILRWSKATHAALQRSTSPMHPQRQREAYSPIRLIRTCVARQLTAAFRSLRQAGSIPSAAESLNQQDCICHTPTQDIDRGDLIREGGTLRGDHFEVARDAAFVTRD